MLVANSRSKTIGLIPVKWPIAQKMGASICQIITAAFLADILICPSMAWASSVVHGAIGAPEPVLGGAGLVILTVMAACTCSVLGKRSSRAADERQFDCARTGDVKLLTRLLRGGLFCKAVDVDARNSLGQTALCVAAKNGQSEAMDILLSRGAQVDSADTNDQTALYIAVTNRYIKATEILLSHGAKLDRTDSNGYTLLSQAVNSGSDVLSQILISHGADTKVNVPGGGSLLDLAAKKGCLKTVEALLSSDLDLNARDKTGKTPLVWAIEYGEDEMAQLLISRGADIRVKVGSLLHLAVIRCQLQTIEALITAGSDVNASDEKGRTPLHLVAQSFSDDRLQVVERLVARGADPNIKDGHGVTPCEAACKALEAVCDKADPVIEKIKNKTESADISSMSPLKQSEWSVSIARDLAAALPKDAQAALQIWTNMPGHFAVMQERLLRIRKRNAQFREGAAIIMDALDGLMDHAMRQQRTNIDSMFGR